MYTSALGVQLFIPRTKRLIMSAMKNLLMKYEDGQMHDATKEELAMTRCMPRIKLMEAIAVCLNSGMTHSSIDQAVLEMKLKNKKLKNEKRKNGEGF